MAAVALYLLPEKGILRVPRTLTKPYVLLLSQWQKWDIFSPDPLRRVSTYVLERDAGDRKVLAATIDYDSLPWWHRAKELKVLSRLEGQWSMLGSYYIRSLCEDIPFGPGSALRLIARSSTLPLDSASLSKVANEKFAITERVLGTFTCPRAS